MDLTKFLLKIVVVNAENITGEDEEKKDAKYIDESWDKLQNLAGEIEAFGRIVANMIIDESRTTKELKYQWSHYYCRWMADVTILAEASQKYG